MYKGKKIAALIAAAGSGKRLSATIPKQFIEIDGKTILEKTAEAFIKNASVDNVYIIISHDQLEMAEKVFKHHDIESERLAFIFGGPTRQDSIYNGLIESENDIDMVLIHDGARPYISQKVIDQVIRTTHKYGAAIPAIPVTDTVKQADSGKILHTPNRDSLYAAQTPQGFEKDLLLSAYEKLREENAKVTDDSMAVELLGHAVHITEGDPENIKITYKNDLPASSDVNNSDTNSPDANGSDANSSGAHNEGKSSSLPYKMGMGYDVHAFADGRDLILGGVKIPHEKGLDGHSDADVLTHALMDGILGALGLGDIGEHFPDNDEKYRGISSLELLENVVEIMKERGFFVGNADITVIAERPKLKEYKDKMKKNLSNKLDISPENINIKATTTEKLGFTGREEGIISQAIVQLIHK